ncbi:MAG: cupin, partial [Marinilabiliales bacterium]
TITFEDGSVAHLSKGDHINIPAHCKHRVSRTDPGQLTIWLAVFYK